LCVVAEFGVFKIFLSEFCKVEMMLFLHNSEIFMRFYGRNCAISIANEQIRSGFVADICGWACTYKLFANYFKQSAFFIKS